MPDVTSARLFITEGDAIFREGNLEQARRDYETAARIGLYHQAKSLVVEAINLAIIPSEGKNLKMCRTLLSNLDKALTIANLYYRGNSKKMEQTIKIANA